MQLLRSWKEGVELFSTKNFKLFLLVTIKSILTTYGVLARYCWLPLGLFIFGSLVPIGFLPAWLAAMVGYYKLLTLSSVVWGSGLLFLLFFLAARSSVSPKTYRYFVSYWYYLIYSTLFMLLSSVLVLYIVAATGKGALYYSYLFFIMIWSSFFFIFLLDSNGYPVQAAMALWRSLKMVFYNLPVILGMWLVAFGMSSLLILPFMMCQAISAKILTAHGADFVTVFLGNIEMVIVIPIYACFMVNIYIKRLHDNFSFYFTVKEK